MADIPGNTTSTVRLPLDTVVDGLHERDDDADWYRVRLEGGTNYTFRAVVSDDGDGSFVDLYLRNARGQIIARAQSYGADGYDFVDGFDYRPAADATFFLTTAAFETGPYQIAAEIDEPAAPPTGRSVRLGEPLERDFFSADDLDTFSVRLERGKAYDLALDGADAASPNLNLTVLDSRGRILFDSSRLGEERVGGSGSPDTLINDFRGSYSGLYFVRAENLDGVPYAYTLTADLDRAARPYDPGAPPSGADDLLVGRLTGADRIDALAGDDLVEGRGGDDELRGGAESDTLFGGDGRDRLFGGANLSNGGGADYLYGEAGDDRLDGGVGQNFLSGGAGRDVFHVSDVLDINDFHRVLDFEKGQDKLDLSGIDANASIAGDQAFRFVGTTLTAAPGQLRYEYFAGSNRTFIDGETGADGDPEQPDFSILVEGRVAFAAADLVL